MKVPSQSNRALVITLCAASLLFWSHSAQSRSSAEERAWRAIASDGTPQEYEDFLSRFPNGRYADEAAEMLDAASAEDDQEGLDFIRSGIGLMELEKAEWDKIRASKRRRDFEQFLENYPNGIFAAEASARLEALPVDTGSPREQAHWQRIKDSTDLDSLYIYLGRYPDGAHADEARQRIATLGEAEEWQRISDSDDMAAYRGYLQDFPQGKHRNQAQQRLRSLEATSRWKAIQNSQDPAEFSAYLRDYPNGLHAPHARRAVRKFTQTAAWRAARDSNDRDQLERFINRYPDSPQRADAERQLRQMKNSVDLVERGYWEAISDSQQRQSFDAYLRKYPNGAHADEARRHIDSIENGAKLLETGYWNAIKDNDDRASFANYLKRYPQGRYADQAEARLRQLSIPAPEPASTRDSALQQAFWRSISNSNDSDDFRAYLRRFPNGVHAASARARIASLQRPATRRNGTGSTGSVRDPMEMAFWNGIRSSRDPDDFAAYLERFPYGAHSQQARRRQRELAAPSPPIASPNNAADDLFWNAIRSSGDADDLQAYLRRFPNGRHAAQARSRLNSSSRDNSAGGTPAQRYALTISVQPSDARVRIMNIGPRYRPGMQLPSGPYHLHIERDGYAVLERWISIADADKHLRLQLTPLSTAPPAVTVQRADRSGGRPLTGTPPASVPRSQQGACGDIQLRTTALRQCQRLTKTARLNPCQQSAGTGCQSGNCDNGTGVYLFASGSCYQGQFVAGRRTGNGVLFHVKGFAYSGQWRNSKRQGTGTYRWKSGRCFHGSWEDNQTRKGLKLSADGEDCSAY